MTERSVERTQPYEPVHLDTVRIVIWETGLSRKKMREKAEEDTRLLYALGTVLEKGGTANGDHLEAAEWICERAERGKPYFVHHPEICFSLSDSEELTAVAFAQNPVGLDIQRHRRHGVQRTEAEENGRLSRMARRFFHPDERDYVLASGTGIRQRFYRVWTAKEACVKYTGQGIDGQFTKLSVMTEPGTAVIPEQLTRPERIGTPVTWQACGCSFYYCEPEEGLSLCLATGMQTSEKISVHIDVY